MKSAAAVRRQLGQILSGKILGLHVNKKDRYDRSSLIAQLSKDEKVINALQELYNASSEVCPADKNTYSKFPAMGDIWYIARHFDQVDKSKQAAFQAFLNVIIDCEIMKGQSYSHRINKTNWFTRFKVKSGPELKESKPIFGGQTFNNQPIPSDNKIRHERQKAGDALIPSNLSSEQGKGDLESTAHPDAFMSNDALPIIPSIHEAMTDLSNAEPTSDMKWKTTMQGHSAETDMKYMKNRSTRHTSGYRAKGQYLPPVPQYATVSETKKSREESMIEAANSQMSTGPGVVTAQGQQQLNVTVYTNTGQGTGGKTTMGGVPETDFSADGDNRGTRIPDHKRLDENEIPRPGAGVDGGWGMPPVVIEPTVPTDEEAGFFGGQGVGEGGGGIGSHERKLDFDRPSPPRKRGRTDSPDEILSPSSQPLPEDTPQPPSRGFNVQDYFITPLALRIFGQGQRQSEQAAGSQAGGASSFAEVEGIADANLRWQHTLDRLDWDLENLLEANDAKTFFKGLMKSAIHFGIGSVKSLSDIIKSGQDIIDFRHELDAWLTMAEEHGDKLASLAHKHIREGVIDYQEIKKVLDDMQKNGRRPSPAMFKRFGLKEGYKSQVSALEKEAVVTPREQETSTTQEEVQDASKPVVGSLQNRKAVHLQSRNRRGDLSGIASGDVFGSIEPEQEPEQTSQQNNPSTFDKNSTRESRARIKKKPTVAEERVWNYLDKEIQTAKRNGTLDKVSQKDKNVYTAYKDAFGFAEGRRYYNNLETWAYDIPETTSVSEKRGQANQGTEGGATAPELALVQTGMGPDVPGQGGQGQGAAPAQGQGAAPAQGQGAAPAQSGPPVIPNEHDVMLRFQRLTSRLKAMYAAYNINSVDKLQEELRTLNSMSKQTRASVLRKELIEAKGGLMEQAIEKQAQYELLLKRIIFEKSQIVKKLQDAADYFEEKGETKRADELEQATISFQNTLNRELDMGTVAGAEFKRSKDYYERMQEAVPDNFWTELNQEDFNEHFNELLEPLPEPEEKKEEKKGRIPEIPKAPGQQGFAGDPSGAGPSGPGPVNEPSPAGAPVMRGQEPAGIPNPLIPVDARITPQALGNNGTTTPSLDRNGQVTANARGNNENGELIINQTIENPYVPTLRLFFREGDANIVNQINDNPVAKELNRDVWYSFNSYDWETNNEGDNPLHLQNIIDEARRFHGQLDKEELMPQMASEATQESYNKYQKEVFQFPKDLQPDAASLMLDVRGGAPLVPQTADQTDSSFHDVYMKPWIDIPESSPWKRFTQIEGTQVSDSYLRDSSNFKSNDNFADRFENAFIYSVDV